MVMVNSEVLVNVISIMKNLFYIIWIIIIYNLVWLF